VSFVRFTVVDSHLYLHWNPRRNG